MRIEKKEIENAFQDQFISLINPECFHGIQTISTDSRQLNNGDVFWALRGDHFDGFKFIDSSLQKTCSGIVMEEKDLDSYQKINKGLCFAVVVKDALKALQVTSAFIREKFNPKTIAITGSNGKTTTKDMLSQILKEKYEVVSSKKSFNNHIGVPLTLWDIDSNTEYCVIEIGMNHKGEIRELMKLVNPHFGVVTNISNGHIGNFKNFEELVLAKRELLEEMNSQGLVFLNHQLKNVPSFHDGLCCEYLEFGRKGEDEQLYCSFDSTQQNGQYIYADIHFEDSSFQIKYSGMGVHNAENICASSALCLYAGMSFEDIQKGLLKTKPPPMRMEKKNFKNGVVLINDAYNSNPNSCEQAVKTFHSLKSIGKKIFVMGDMKELGIHSKKLHEEIGKVVLESNVDCLLTYGEMSEQTAKIVSTQSDKNVQVFQDKNLLCDYVEKYLKNNDLILIKGSRSNALETVVDRLEKKWGRELDV